MNRGRPPGAYTQAVRALRMRAFLMAHWPATVSVEELTHTFGVDQRTVRRDIDALIEAGEQIERRKGGQFFWHPRTPLEALERLSTLPRPKQHRAAIAALFDKVTERLVLARMEDSNVAV